MQQNILHIDEARGTVEMRSLVDSDGTDALNAALRKQGKGFTRGRTMRFALNINLAEWNALLANMDKDALDFEASHWSDRNVLRRLWYRFPQWRASEGGV